METIKQKMQQSHSHGDRLFLHAEELVENNNWDAAQEALMNFKRELLHHFNMEELVLFPELEEKTGHIFMPAQMMQSEHVHMRALLSDMVKTVEEQNREDYLGLSETMLIMMQQHNIKEESIIYPISDRLLAQQLPHLLSRMDQVSSE
jgi:DUF438 domain-containing protein